MGMWRECARWLLAGLVVGLGLSACGSGEAGGGEPSPASSESEAGTASNGEVDKSRVFRAKIHAEGTGAAQFAWDGEQDIQLTRVGGPGIEVNLLSAGFAAPEILPHDRAHRFRWAFDLLSGFQDKAGTFEISADPVNAQGLKSQAFLIWLKVKDPSKDAVHDMEEVEFLKEFNQIQEPCTLEVDDTASNGTLTCPALATADGEVAGLTVTWEEITA